MQPSTQKSRSLLSPFLRQESCCRSNVTSRVAPLPMGRPKMTSRIWMRSWRHAIRPLRRPRCLKPHRAAARRYLLSQLPTPYIHSCECYPRMTTHFFLFRSAAHQQPRRPQTRFPSFGLPRLHPHHHPHKVRPIKDLSSLGISFCHLALERKVSSLFLIVFLLSMIPFLAFSNKYD